MIGVHRIDARGISKIYGRHRALSQVELSLSAGKVTTLLGPNGAGKTTLLWILSTLSRPTTGKLRFLNSSENEIPEVRRTIGLLSHNALAYGDLSGLENLVFFAKVYGCQGPESVAETLLSQFGLAEAGNRLVRDYSRGMQQRLGLARAIIGEPSVLLLDEPFSGLDQASADRLQTFLQGYASQDRLVVLVSHDFARASALGRHFVFLRRGAISRTFEGCLELDDLFDLYRQSQEGTS